MIFVLFKKILEFKFAHKGEMSGGRADQHTGTVDSGGMQLVMTKELPRKLMLMFLQFDSFISFLHHEKSTKRNFL